MKNKIGIYPGTFDPLTYGHLDIIRRSLKIVDNLIIGIADNDNKKLLETYRDGMLYGKSTEWWKNGNIKSETVTTCV